MENIVGSVFPTNQTKDFRLQTDEAGNLLWDLAAGIREMIANAMDASGREFNIYREDEFLVIENNKSLEPRHFIFGEGEGGAIGQFHEGMKIFVLIALREGVETEIEAGAYKYTPEWTESFGVPVVGIRIGSGNCEGTRVRIRTALNLSDISLVSDPADLFEKSKKSFIVENARDQLAIHTFKCKKSIKSLFGYSLNPHKSHINPNREFDETPIGYISETLAAFANKRQMKMVLELASCKSSELIEANPSSSSASWAPKPEKRGEWIETFYEMYGENAFLSTEPKKTARALAKSKNPVSLTTSWTRILNAWGVKTDYELVEERELMEVLKNPAKEIRKNIRDAMTEISYAVMRIHKDEDFPYDKDALLYHNPHLSNEDERKAWAKAWADQIIKSGVVTKYFDDDDEELLIAGQARGDGNWPSDDEDDVRRITIKREKAENYWTCLYVLIHEIAHMLSSEGDNCDGHINLMNALWLAVHMRAKPNKGKNRSNSDTIVIEC